MKQTGLLPPNYGCVPYLMAKQEAGSGAQVRSMVPKFAQSNEMVKRGQ